MKKLTFSLIGICVFSSLSYSQIYKATPEQSSGTGTTVMGASYTGTDAVTVINAANSNTSSRKALELRYSVGDLFSYPVTQPVFVINKKNNAAPAGVYEIFSIQDGGQTFMGTTNGTSKLNIGGGIEGFGTYMNYAISTYDLSFSWKANTTLTNKQRFIFKYDDGTNPALEMFSLHKEGMFAIGHNITAPEATLHVLTEGSDPAENAFIVKSGAGDIFSLNKEGNAELFCNNTGAGQAAGDVFGLTVKNTGWSGSHFALEVESGVGKIFSVANSGHVLIGAQDQGEINQAIPEYWDYRLYVAKGIRTERIRVDVAADNGWADYVFEKDYKLMSLSEVEAYINENGHLPKVPSAEKVAEEGIDLAEMNKILLEKIEELTLHVIELEKKIDVKSLENE